MRRKETEAKQATNIFKRNSLFLNANIKVSFVALNQIQKMNPISKAVSGQFWNCYVQQNCWVQFVRLQTAPFSRSTFSGGLGLADSRNISGKCFLRVFLSFSTSRCRRRCANSMQPFSCPTTHFRWQTQMRNSCFT